MTDGRGKSLLGACGLTAAEQQTVASGNTLRLPGLG